MAEESRHRIDAPLIQNAQPRTLNTLTNGTLRTLKNTPERFTGFSACSAALASAYSAFVVAVFCSWSRFLFLAQGVANEAAQIEPAPA